MSQVVERGALRNFTYTRSVYQYAYTHTPTHSSYKNAFISVYVDIDAAERLQHILLYLKNSFQDTFCPIIRAKTKNDLTIYYQMLSVLSSQSVAIGEDTDH